MNKLHSACRSDPKTSYSTDAFSRRVTPESSNTSGSRQPFSAVVAFFLFLLQLALQRQTQLDRFTRRVLSPVTCPATSAQLSTIMLLSTPVFGTVA